MCKSTRTTLIDLLNSLTFLYFSTVYFPLTIVLKRLFAGDWPLVKRGRFDKLAMFSWCGSEDTEDIVFPTYELTEASLQCMGRQEGRSRFPNLLSMSIRLPGIFYACLYAYTFFICPSHFAIVGSDPFGLVTF